MAFSLVAHQVAQATGASTGATTSAIDTSGATLLIVTVSSYEGGDTPTLSDSKSNTWTARTTRTGSGIINEYYAENPTVGSAHTFSVSGNNTYASIAAAAFSGAATSSVYDSVEGTAFDTATSLNTGSITPNTANALVFAGLISATTDQPASTSVSNSYTLIDSVSNVSGQAYGVATAWKEVASGSTSTTFTYASSAVVQTVITAYKPSAGGSAPTATISVTEAADTLSSSARVSAVASFSATEAADTLSASAISSNTRTASLSATEATDTLSSAATVEARATFSATEAADTLSASGTVTTVAGPSASLSATEASDTQVSAGTVAVIAAFAATESADTMSGVAQIQISATFSATEAADTMSAAASSGGALTASVAWTEDPDTGAFVAVDNNPNGSNQGAGRRRRTLRILPDQKVVWADDREIVDILRTFYKQEEKVPFRTREQVRASTSPKEKPSVHWKSYVARGDLVEFDEKADDLPVPKMGDLRRVPKGMDAFSREMLKRKQDEQDIEDIMRFL